MANRYKSAPSLAQVYEQGFNKFESTVLDSLRLLQETADAQDRKNYQNKALKYETVSKLFPEIALKEEFVGWENSTEEGNDKFNAMMGYAEDMYGSFKAGQRFNPQSGTLSIDADEAMTFGVNRDIEAITGNDFDTYNQWLFGQGSIARAQGWKGLVSKKFSELTSAEIGDLEDKALLKPGENWDELVSTQSGIQRLRDRFDTFKSGFIQAEGGDKFWTERELLDLRRHHTEQKITDARLINAIPEYIEAKNSVAAWDTNNYLANLITMESGDPDRHGGYWWRDGNGLDHTVDTGNQNSNMNALEQQANAVYTALNNDISDLSIISRNDPTFMTRLEGESPAVFREVTKHLEAFNTKTYYDRQINMSVINESNHKEQINNMVDVALLAADGVTSAIDEAFKSFEGNTSAWRSAFVSDEEFNNSPIMQNLLNKVRMIEDKFTVQGNAQYNANVAAYLQSLKDQRPDVQYGIDVMLEDMLGSRLQDASFSKYFSPPTKAMFLQSDEYISNPDRYRLEDGFVIDAFTGQQLMFKGGF